MSKRPKTKDPKTMTTAELRAELDDVQALLERKEKLEKMLNKQ